MKMKTGIVAVLLSVFFVSCKKDKNEDPSETSTNTDSETLKTLKAGHWNEYKYTIGGSDISYDACELDNYLIFTSNTEYSNNEGSNVCSPSQAGSSTWALPTSTKITFETTDFQITKLNSDSLNIRRYDDVNDLWFYKYYKNIK